MRCTDAYSSTLRSLHTLPFTTTLHVFYRITLVRHCLDSWTCPHPSSVRLGSKQIFPCRRVILQNEKYYSRFPGDVGHVQRFVMHLDSLPGGGAPLPSGGLLTPRSLQLLGLSGLGSAGGFERLHFLLERAFVDEELSDVFRRVGRSSGAKSCTHLTPHIQVSGLLKNVCTAALARI